MGSETVGYDYNELSYLFNSNFKLDWEIGICKNSKRSDNLVRPIKAETDDYIFSGHSDKSGGSSFVTVRVKTGEPDGPLYTTYINATSLEHLDSLCSKFDYEKYLKKRIAHQKEEIEIASNSLEDSKYDLSLIERDLDDWLNRKQKQ